jgi:hypothetical protein
MSAVVVVIPLVVANWAAISAAVGAAVGTLGFALTSAADIADSMSSAKSKERIKEEMDVDNAEILAGTSGIEEKIVVQKEGLQATFSRNARGGLKLCLEGAGYTKSEMRRIGQELIGRVTQQYVYNRVISELKERKMTVVDEEVTEDRTVKIRVRNW